MYAVLWPFPYILSHSPTSGVSDLLLSKLRAFVPLGGFSITFSTCPTSAWFSVPITASFLSVSFSLLSSSLDQPVALRDVASNSRSVGPPPPAVLLGEEFASWEIALLFERFFRGGGTMAGLPLTGCDFDRCTCLEACWCSFLALTLSSSGGLWDGVADAYSSSLWSSSS